MADGGVLYLFADTNVFLQCKPLRELRWDAFGSCERIELVITRPVQTEIDSLKDGGNARKSARARLASALIHELLEAEDGRMELPVQPPVHVRLRHDLRRDESAADVLDYGERDDQLVGTALAFLRSEPDGAVRLLTNDTGPKASAKAVGLEYVGIPADWLLAPEQDEAERQLNRLRAENERLRSQEPAVELQALAPHAERLERALQFYAPLAPAQRDELLAELLARFPLTEDFGSQVPAERVVDLEPGPTLLGQRKERYEPVSAERIAEYKRGYERWREECRTMLDDLAKHLNRQIEWPQLTVRILNTGTRPAEDTLVELKAAGNSFLMPPRRDDDEAGQKVAGPLVLPRPPLAPKGNWRRIDPFEALRGAGITDILALQRANASSRDIFRNPAQLMPKPPDPNSFYFKKGRRGVPSKHISYECAQWRHAQEPEDFMVAVLCPVKPGKHNGLITVVVHAANLTNPVELRLPVAIEIQELSCLEKAQALVAAL